MKIIGKLLVGLCLLSNAFLLCIQREEPAAENKRVAQAALA